MGIEPNHIIISEIGAVIEVSQNDIRIKDSVPSGRILVDGTSVGEVGSVVLRDRKHLAQDGMLVVIVNLSSDDGSLISGPDIITRGFIYVKESEELMSQLKDVVLDTLTEFNTQKVSDWTALKRSIKADLSTYLYKKAKRNPMILPVVTEI
jgi:ribonuclease J